MHAEDGRIRADAQRQSEDYCKGQAEFPAKAEDRRTKTPTEGVQPLKRHVLEQLPLVVSFFPFSFHEWVTIEFLVTDSLPEINPLSQRRYHGLSRAMHHKPKCDKPNFAADQ